MNYTAGNQDVDIFSDDDFPDIPDDELQKLEQEAISFTQQAFTQQELQSRPRHQVRTARQRNHGPDTSKQNTLQGRVTNKLTSIQSAAESLRPDSSDGTIFDEDGFLVVPAEAARGQIQHRQDEVAQREQWRLNRFAQPHAQASRKPIVAQASARNEPRQAARLFGHNFNQNSDAISSGAYNSARTERNLEDEALRTQIAELIRERDELSTNLRMASDEISARRGEVSNIRANRLNEERVHQNQLAALKKLQEEESEKHTATLQAMKAENGKSASEIQFLKQELKEETRRAQAYQRQLKERPLSDKPTNVNTTPKRNHSLRDGFDDNEIMVISPVKSGRKSKQGTPTANRKRKQPVIGDPHVTPLTLRLSGSNSAENEPHKSVPESKAEKVISVYHKDHATRRHLRLIQNVTNFNPGGGHETLAESLFKLSFPSEPRKNFGTIVTEAMAKLEGDRLPGDLVQIFVDIWSRTMKEEYYGCLKLLIEVISYILEQDPFAIDKAMLCSFLPVLEATISVNATARFKLMQKDYLNNRTKQTPMINPDISITSCLDLLYTIACLSSDDNELIDLFWRTVSTDLVLMMLNACQAIPDIILMLKLLATSILPNTFGNICEASQQGKYEAYTTDRICFLLWESSKPEADKLSYPHKQLCLLRQESLNLLAHLTLGSSPNPFNPASANNYGTNFIANHPSAIARIVRSIYDELAAAYLMTSTQHLHARLVNSAVQIVHFVLFSPAGRQTSWQTKINAINGVGHKFRVAMARLAYAEGMRPGIDAGITEDTTRMATEILLEIVTPDEIEDLVKIFEGDNVSSGRRTSAMTSTQR